MKKNSGITLIALVITIIVMLILVAVTITMAVNGKLFEYSGKATRDIEIAKEDELNLGHGQVEVDGDFYKTLDDYLEGKPSEKFSKIYTKTEEYKETINGVETVTAWIPKGFAVGTSEGINKVEDGLVIQDKDGNEFVWIPVEFEATGNVDSHELYDGFLSAFYRSAWSDNARTMDLSSDYIEPRFISSTTPTAYRIESAEYYDMMKSVQDHKGFYIGRYEAGSKVPRTFNSEASNPIIKQDAYPYNFVKWGESMTLVGEEGAVALSKKMYDSDQYGVVSTLCYGVQWDAMLDFIKDDNHNISNSTTWGNFSNSTWVVTRKKASYYEDTEKKWTQISDEQTHSKEKEPSVKIILTTGANDNFKAKNIYDVAGNLSEWTMEIYGNAYRVYRGGNYLNAGNYCAAAYRTNNYPFDKNSTIGFRPTLYVL